MKQKYFADGKQKISRRDFKELLVELVTGKTPEEIIAIHKKTQLDTAEKKITYAEKMIFEYMDQRKERSFDIEEVQRIIDEKEIINFISQKVLENTNKYKTDQHHHQTKKEILKKVEETVRHLTGDEL